MATAAQKKKRNKRILIFGLIAAAIYGAYIWRKSSIGKFMTWGASVGQGGPGTLTDPNTIDYWYQTFEGLIPFNSGDQEQQAVQVMRWKQYKKDNFIF